MPAQAKALSMRVASGFLRLVEGLRGEGHSEYDNLCHEKAKSCCRAGFHSALLCPHSRARLIFVDYLIALDGVHLAFYASR
jgi:hypothetical protein